MFSFNSLHKGSHKASRSPASRSLASGTLRRFFAQSAFALIALSALLVFSGCDDKPPPPDPFVDDHILNSNLIGTWMTDYDNYVINDTKLTYDDGFGDGYAGNIVYVSNFNSSKNAGVIIIEYDADKKPTYYDSFENWGESDHIVPLNGDFIGIYYKTLKPGVSVQMGQAYATDRIGGSEEATLEVAKAAFTRGKEGTYMTYYGTYTKQ